MHRQRGLSIFGLIALVALTALIVWTLLQVIKLPLPKSTNTQMYTANTSDVEAPTLVPSDTLDATTTATSSIMASTTSVTATSTATSTGATSTPQATPAKTPTKKV